MLVAKKPPVYHAIEYKGEENRDEVIIWLREVGQYGEVYWVIPFTPGDKGHIVVILPESYIEGDDPRPSRHCRISSPCVIVLDDDYAGGFRTLSLSSFASLYDVEEF